jgi:hypothetical protein
LECEFSARILSLNREKTHEAETVAEEQIAFALRQADRRNANFLWFE